MGERIDTVWIHDRTGERHAWAPATPIYIRRVRPDPADDRVMIFYVPAEGVVPNG